jgi:hypothetical protein
MSIAWYRLVILDEFALDLWRSMEYESTGAVSLDFFKYTIR